MAQDTTISYSALEHYILDTLRNRFGQCATIADLAQATRLPPGTVRMGMQWLLAYGLIEWLTEGECYRVVGAH
jgi:DNA-binding IclR family transcriptional regulator